MNIVMTGATGLVGSALVETLAADGHRVYRLMRPESTKKEVGAANVFDVAWNPNDKNSDKVFVSSDRIVGDIDAVINLAGASIADGKWTTERKSLLRSSRIETTRALVDAMERMARRPRVFISASAIGYYGDRGEEILTESSAPGAGFLPELCEKWETQAIKAETFGVRVIRARFGIILAKHGGALPKMMTPFKLGAGGKLGSGKQWMSWITLKDVVRFIQHALEEESLLGAINVVAPGAVRNVEFTEGLAIGLHRPAVFTVPAFALRMAMGEMADSLLLSSARVVPKKLEQRGFRFLHATLAEALRAILN